MLAELSAMVERVGAQLLIARDVGQVRDVLRQAGSAKALGRVYPTIDEAVEAARATPTP